ncbi:MULTISPECIES: sensor histidine kinase [Paraburkholderia]|uniref:sensor histidine kinase n=1 Tax=Paraburkholderia TaxID=1822464 RepID=UPI001CAEF65E|nr:MULTISPECIES: ATP-binding protein [Paraburkholderia]MDR6379673.1 signal transduction histidine kinase [Paraburkholderia caribensis]CAG9195898.1 Putative SigmaB asociated two-component system sensor protein [Paraburkholderia caribensis]
MTTPILRIRLEAEEDVVAARRKARAIAAGFGFSMLDQTRIASAVSEIARNAFEYAYGGEVTFAFDGASKPQALIIDVRDRGPGIRELESVLDGTYRSSTGMGRGIAGSRRLMDRCEIESSAERGTAVTMARFLPLDRPEVAASGIDAIMRNLVQQNALGGRPGGARSAGDAARRSFDEVLEQNRELLATLTELRDRQDELTRLTQELEATNRGVVALYAELDERADELRRADTMKSRFLSNMSHELRTPLSSIRALSNLLVNRLDGDLSAEQERQVLLIRKSAEDLTEIVNDLLDLAKIEAGRTELTPAWFKATGLFAALRPMLTPLQTDPSVKLIFEDAYGLPPIFADEAKLTQILRNFVSNALKFTERGEIRVGARMEPDGEHVTFFVADTGIGIAEEHQQVIFEEFGQVQNHLQQRVKGTGLGLPLCRKLAALLGGHVGVDSKPGVGSTFFATLPLEAVAGPRADDATGGPAIVHGGTS